MIWRETLWTIGFRERRNILVSQGSVSTAGQWSSLTAHSFNCSGLLLRQNENKSVSRYPGRAPESNGSNATDCPTTRFTMATKQCHVRSRPWTSQNLGTRVRNGLNWLRVRVTIGLLWIWRWTFVPYKCQLLQTVRVSATVLPTCVTFYRSWRWKQYVPPKRLYPPTSPHGVTAQKTNIDNVWGCARRILFWRVQRTGGWNNTVDTPAVM
jgi:hypothetical protein